MVEEVVLRADDFFQPAVYAARHFKELVELAHGVETDSESLAQISFLAVGWAERSESHQEIATNGGTCGASAHPTRSGQSNV